MTPPRLAFHRLPFPADTLVRPALVSDQVHLFCTRLDTPQTGGHFESLLTDDERRRADRFRMGKVREQFIAARGSLRHLLAGYLEIDPRQVPIQYQDGGKPLLASPFADWHFNVSHCQNVAAFAVSRCGRVGIDVEKVRHFPNMDGLVERFFAPSERRRFAAYPLADRTEAFFRAWTRKEAILKAVGHGVQSLDCCEVNFDTDEEPAILRLEADYQAREKWSLECWQPEAGYLAAVAAERPLPVENVS